MRRKRTTTRRSLMCFLKAILELAGLDDQIHLIDADDLVHGRLSPARGLVIHKCTRFFWNNVNVADGAKDFQKRAKGFGADGAANALDKDGELRIRIALA